MAVEFRGCKNLVVAEIISDNAEDYTTGEVMPLAPVAEISKTVETSSEAHYYDNKAAILIDSEGADTVTFTCAVPNDATLAKITGRTYDTTKKMFIESERKQKYFAVGYILGEVGDNGSDERYVWRLKGTFNQPDEDAKTVDGGTGASNVSIIFTGIYTDYKFNNGQGLNVKGSAKADYIRKSSGIATEEQFFAQVTTPDTEFTPPTPTTYHLTITQAENTTVTVTRDSTPLDNNAEIAVGDVLTISVTGGTVTVNGEAFTSGETYTVAGDTAVVSTATE